MNLMKVLDQAVREIKREVNLKVLKVPEIEQKVLDATSDEPWGPHGSDLAEIARATKRYGECGMVLDVLCQRLGDTSANWRHLYKALVVIEHLLANGSERAVDDIIENSAQIAKLTSFEYVEPNGKDVGLNVRKKAENILAIVDDREKLQQVRDKAAATRDKYLGLSSTGITSKSSTASFGSGVSDSRHRSTTSSREVDSFRTNYSGKEWTNNSKGTASVYGSTRQMSRENTNGATNHKLTKREGHSISYQGSSTSPSKPSSNLSATPSGPSLQKMDDEYDDDFNPRGCSASVNARSNHVDLFGQSSMDELINMNTMANVGTAPVPDVDLFADSDFQSATAPLETATGSHPQGSIDLFVCRSSFADSVTSDTESSVHGSPNKCSEHNLPSPLYPSAAPAFDPFQPSFATLFPSETSSTSLQEKKPANQHSIAADFDPFSAVSLKSFDVSNSFGASSSNRGPDIAELRHGPPGSVKSSDHSPLEEPNFGAYISGSPTENGITTRNKFYSNPESSTMSASKPDVKKGAFQVKSGIWADSLSRGLIDLNITSPKKVDLSDVGIVGQLNKGSEVKGSASPWYMGTTMGIGSGLSRSGFPSSTGTTTGSSDFQQQQFGTFK